MLYEKIDILGAANTASGHVFGAEDEPHGGSSTNRERLTVGARIFAIICVLALPAFLGKLVLELLWQDAKAIGRSVRVAFQIYAEAFARR